MDLIGYSEFIQQLKQKIYTAKTKAIISVNKELIKLYFEIGKEIVSKQEALGWGKSVVEEMSKDLKKEFEEKSGYSTQNLWYMRQFYITYRDNLNLQQLVGEISWSHNIQIFSKCKTEEEREYYIKQTIKYGWSRNVLIHHIKTNLFQRDDNKNKLTNFHQTLSTELSELAIDSIKSEYNLEFLNLSNEYKERELENSIINNIRDFLLELGKGFSFIDSQYKLTLGKNEYFIDLLFFNRYLNSLVVIELKTGKFKPEYAGKMNFYLNVLNDKVKLPHENPAIGIILCTDSDDIEIEYSLSNVNQPMGVSTYTTKELPKEVKDIIPTKEEFNKMLKGL